MVHVAGRGVCSFPGRPGRSISAGLALPAPTGRGSRHAFEHGHSVTVTGEQQGRDGAGHAAAHDRDPHRSPNVLITDSTITPSVGQ